MSTTKLRYIDLVKRLNENHGRVCYDASRCKDPVCGTIVKALIEYGQGSGWSIMWALHIIAIDVQFDELFGNLCGNAMSWIKSALWGWETDDETDYKNAILIYEKFILLEEDEEEVMQPPVLMDNNVQ